MAASGTLTPGCTIRKPWPFTGAWRVDHCWTCVAQHGPFSTPEKALDTLSIDMRGGDAPELLPPGARRRSSLIEIGPRGSSPEFDLLIKSMSHLPALMAVGECYLVLPRPDPNFVPDLQTNNFAWRLFELYLLARFREQGLRVRQDHVSPDFQIEKDGATCWVEAVTANSETPRAGGIGDWVHAPADRTERLTGAAAERFAKTLRGKLQREYHDLSHVKGHPFAIAIADFHSSGSMVWSREALPTYLYGLRADVEGEGAERRAVGRPISNLTGRNAIPASLFRDPACAQLSAVISPEGLLPVARRTEHTVAAFYFDSIVRPTPGTAVDVLESNVPHDAGRGLIFPVSASREAQAVSPINPPGPTAASHGPTSPMNTHATNTSAPAGRS